MSKVEKAKDSPIVFGMNKKRKKSGRRTVLPENKSGKSKLREK
jgi:hypothetical protein